MAPACRGEQSISTAAAIAAVGSFLTAEIIASQAGAQGQTASARDVRPLATSPPYPFTFSRLATRPAELGFHDSRARATGTVCRVERFFMQARKGDRHEIYRRGRSAADRPGVTDCARPGSFDN